MRNKNNQKKASWIACMVLMLVMAFTIVGCRAKDAGDFSQSSQEISTAGETNPTILGEGQTKFSLLVVDKEGKEINFEIHTNQTTVGKALLEVGLVDGEASEQGLYIKTVNGITADYDVDQTYWAFYLNGEYASTGVDTTSIEEGVTYSLKVEK